MVRVASVIVSGGPAGFRDPSIQEDKEHLAGSIALACRQFKVALVLLPAGYLCTDDKAQGAERETAKRLAAVFRGCALVGGVDSARARRGDDDHGKGTPLGDKWVAGGDLPYWLFASDVNGEIAGDLGFVQQRSTLYNYDRVPVDRRDLAATARRIVKVGGLRVYLLVCGEIFNPEVRQAIGALRGEVDLVAHLSHRGLGRSFGRTYPPMSRKSGAWVLNAQHIGESRVSPRKWGVGPRARSSWWREDADTWVGTRSVNSRKSKGLWAEVAVWQIPRGGVERVMPDPTEDDPAGSEVGASSC
jgi:predicted amidohydrolase